MTRVRLDYPPEDRREPDALDDIHLRALCEEHQQAPHGYFAVEALVYCREARVVPPTWVIDWFGDAFAQWIDDPTTGLVDALRLASPGRGKRPPRETIRDQAAREHDAWLMYILNQGFRISVEHAAELVAEMRDHNGDNARSATWLVESFRKEWRARLDGTLAGEDLAAHYDPETPHGAAARREFLQQFPRRSILRVGLE